MDKTRCAWANRSPLEMKYHDEEWGNIHTDDDYLFEFLVLESMQAGLSWTTIINKREDMRKAFDNFNPIMIKEYRNEKIEELLKNDKIIRHRKKLEAMINNASVFLEIQEKYTTFCNFIWKYVEYTPIINDIHLPEDIETKSPLSEEISKDFKKLGFKFLGPTSIYAYMEAIGMIDNHLNTCFRKSKS